MDKLLICASNIEFETINPDHPNKQYWKGKITTVNNPSNLPPNGTNGLCVQLEKDGVLANIDTLKGMPVNITCNTYDGHNLKTVVGIVTNGWIEDDVVWAEGHLFPENFPDECKTIRANKDILGFSYELLPKTKEVIDNILCVKDMCFTGLSILLKDAAAYGDDTQLIAAQKNKKVDDINMDKKELEELLNGMFTKFKEEVGTIKASVDTAIADVKADIVASNEKIETIKAGIEEKVDAINTSVADTIKASIATEPKPAVEDPIPAPKANQTIQANTDLTPAKEDKKTRIEKINASKDLSMMEKIKEITKIKYEEEK